MSAPTQVVALYRFVRLDDFESLREPLLNFCLDRNIKGTLLLAREGINGTVAGSSSAIEALLEYLTADDRWLIWTVSFPIMRSVRSCE